MEEQIQRIMQGLKCSREEAEQVYKDDKAIDKGERMSFDLPPEVEKEARKYGRTGTRAYNFDTTNRKRKENPTKSSIIKELAEFLTNQSENACENVQITNKERQIAFAIGDNKYELTLVQKRAPKGSK